MYTSQRSQASDHIDVGDVTGTAPVSPSRNDGYACWPVLPPLSPGTVQRAPHFSEDLGFKDWADTEVPGEMTHANAPMQTIMGPAGPSSPPAPGDTIGPFLMCLTPNGEERVVEESQLEKNELEVVRGGEHIIMPVKMGSPSKLKSNPSGVLKPRERMGFLEIRNKASWAAGMPSHSPSFEKGNLICTFEGCEDKKGAVRITSGDRAAVIEKLCSDLRIKFKGEISGWLGARLPDSYGDQIAT